MTLVTNVVEAFYGGAWHTMPRYDRDPIVMTRGKTPESPNTPPQTATFTVDNRTGLWNPRNPLSPLYDTDGRNTPIRITIEGQIRWYGEASKWVPGRSTRAVTATKGDAWVKVTAAGIKRRLGQGADPLPSALKKWLTANADYYWPLGEGEGTTWRPTLGTTVPIVPDGATPVAAYSDAAGAGALVPWLEAGLKLPAGGAGVRTQSGVGFNIPPGAGGQIAFAWVAQRTPNTSTSGPTGSGWSVTIQDSTASVTVADVRFFAHEEVDVLSNGTTAHAANHPEVATSDALLVWIVLQNSGANMAWELHVGGRGTIASGTVATFNTPTIGPIYLFSGSGEASFGHLAVFRDLSKLANLEAAFNGWPGETALARFTRLCSENGITPYQTPPVGGAGTQQMGPQYVATFLEQMREIEDVDGALVTELRDGPGLVMVCGAAFYTKPVTLTVDAAAGQLAPGVEPVLDDLGVRNDITLKRRSGGEVHVEDAASIASPTGRVSDSPTVNASSVEQLARLANWRLHEGTVNRSRWPALAVDLVANPGLALADLSSRVQIANLTADQSPNDGDQLVMGYTETVTRATRRISYACKSFEHDRVGIVGSARCDTSGCVTVGSFLSGTATSLSVSNTAGSQWTTKPGSWPFDIMVAGVRLRVTSVSGTGASQTLTVQATPINGIVKTIPTNSKVRLAEPSYVALGGN